MWFDSRKLVIFCLPGQNVYFLLSLHPSLIFSRRDSQLETIELLYKGVQWDGGNRQGKAKYEKERERGMREKGRQQQRWAQRETALLAAPQSRHARARGVVSDRVLPRSCYHSFTVTIWIYAHKQYCTSQKLTHWLKGISLFLLFSTLLNNSEDIERMK